jgi:hypothetical protein
MPMARCTAPTGWRFVIMRGRRFPYRPGMAGRPVSQTGAANGPRLSSRWPEEKGPGEVSMATHGTGQVATRARRSAVSADDPVLAAKITAPGVPEWAVQRPRITKLIAEDVRWCQLTVVTGLAWQHADGRPAGIPDPADKKARRLGSAWPRSSWTVIRTRTSSSGSWPRRTAPDRLSGGGGAQHRAAAGPRRSAELRQARSWLKQAHATLRVPVPGLGEANLRTPGRQVVVIVPVAGQLRRTRPLTVR